MDGQASSPFPPIVQRLRPLLLAQEQPVYFVGGMVRDALMGRAVHDVDLVVASGAIALTFRLADALGLPAFALDDERDVGRVIIPGQELTIDIARFRGPTLEDDLLGRDFTINAMASPVGGQLPSDVIDLHDGLSDLQAGRVRAVHERSIEEDPVRALRAARFTTQFGFALDEATAAAATAAAPLLATRTSAERIRDELSRLLTNGAPHDGIELLRRLDLLPVVLPDVAAMFNVAQSAPHTEDVYHHTLAVLRYLTAVVGLVIGALPEQLWEKDVAALLSPYGDGLRAHLDQATDGGFRGSLLLMWAGMLHDVGKPRTQTKEAGGRIRFLGHDAAGADMAARLLTAYSFSNEAVRRVRTTVAGHMRPLMLALDKRLPSRKATYRYYRALREAGLDVGLLSLADHLGTYGGVGDGAEWESLRNVVGALFHAYFAEHEDVVAPPRLLDGRVIMTELGRPPGHEIGRLLAMLEEAQAVGDVTTRDEAIAFIHRHAG